AAKSADHGCSTLTNSSLSIPNRQPLLSSVETSTENCISRKRAHKFLAALKERWLGITMRTATLSVLVAFTLLAGCQHGPPKEYGPFREPDLIEVATLDPTIRLDIRYATTNNFLHRPVYAQAKAFLQRPAAEALLRAHRSLKAKGYGVLVFDGYRPW